MALQATFVADFTQFESSLKNATATLEREFKVSSTNVSRQLQSLAQSFSGSKIIADAQKVAAAVEAIGGAAKLTEKEQARVNATVTEAIAKYQALGKVAPAELQKLASETAKISKPVEDATQKTGLLGKAFSSLGPQLAAAVSVGAITAFIGKTIDWADSMQDLAERTGFTTTTIQRLSAVANTSGTSVEAMTKSIGFMSRTLGDKSSGTIKALDELGLGYDALARMSPEQQFETIAKALVKVENENRRVSLGADLLGKTFIEIQPALKKVAEGLEDIPVASEKAIKAAADIKDAWEETKRGFLVAAAEIMGALKSLKESWVGTIAEMVSGRGAMRAGSRNNWLTDWLGLNLDDVKAPEVALSSYRRSLDLASDATIRTADQTRAMDAALQRVIPTVKSAEAEQKKAADAAKQHATELENERKALDKLTGADGLDRALQLLKQIDQIGGVQFIDPAQAPAALQTLNSAIGYLDRMGVSADETRDKLLAMWAALQPGVPGLTGAAPIFPGLQHGAIPATGMPGLEGGADIFDWLAGAQGTGAIGGKPAAQTFMGGFGSTLQQGLPSVIGEAMQGGGNVAGSIGSMLGTSIGAGIASAMGPALGIGMSIALGAATMGIGLVVGLMFTKLFSPSEEDRAKALRAELIAQAGGLDKIRQMADVAGVSMSAFLSARTQNNVKKELQAIQSAFDAVIARVQQLDEELKQVSASGTLISPDLMKEILRDQNAPGARASLGAFISRETQRAVEGINTLMASPYLGGGALQGAQETIVGLFGALTTQGYSAAQALALLEPAMAGVYTQIGQALPSYKALMVAQREFDEATDPEARAIAQTALTDAQAAYNAELKGMPIEAFRELSGLAALAADAVAGPAIEAVAGLKDVLTGTFNAGLLTEGMFAGLAGTITDTYGTIIERGGTANQALRLMQPSLQVIWQLMRDFGYEVDDATQAIIDQAEAEGLIGEKFRPAADRMATAIDNLISKIGDLITMLIEALPDGARRGADGIVREIGNVRPTIEVGVRYVDQGGIAAVTNVRAMAEGGIVTRPTLALLGEAGPEAVVPLNSTRNLNPVVVKVDARGAYVGDYASQQSFAGAIEAAVSQALRGNLRFAGA